MDAIPDLMKQVADVAANEAGAKAFVKRLVMQIVFDVLERQGPNALLPDAVISTILSQLQSTRRVRRTASLLATVLREFELNEKGIVMCHRQGCGCCFR
ncbi:hypothetical protein KIN20_027256 [Parelaphostrongylus tenuis]|uniref:Uncharacterized protein n=1 Tax=Parelaphostrongylus tenuis TaxID=148309 RepID=A0AAD5QZC8_PARTN|nr:hypothetical protein KIN20_027256 [Parelaphostrongylus tenuis]